jgi:transcriptional regulator with XRE-family HTH domain
MTPFGKRVAARIKAKRIALGITQTELALLFGCSVSLIQHYEKGFCQMPIEALNDFAKLCRVPIDWFFLEEHEMLVYVILF